MTNFLLVTLTVITALIATVFCVGWQKYKSGIMYGIRNGWTLTKDRYQKDGVFVTFGWDRFTIQNDEELVYSDLLGALLRADDVINEGGVNEYKLFRISCFAEKLRDANERLEKSGEICFKYIDVNFD